MNILIISTFSSKLVAALKYKDKIYNYTEEQAGRTHSVKLPGAVDGLLKQAGAVLSDMDYLGAVTGPGSFTGIRIGINVINAFARATGKQTLGVSAFDAAAYNIKEQSLLLLDAKHGKYYAARIDNEKLRIENCGILNKKQVDSYNCNKIITDENFAPSAESLIWAAERKIKSKEFGLTPLYMQASEAERNAN